MLIEIFKTIEDHRDREARQYQLWEVLTLYVFAILGNAKTYEDIARFGRENFNVLKENFGFKWKRIPHYTQIRRILLGVKNELLEKAFRQHSQILSPQEGFKQICFDGKTLRGSRGKNPNSAIQLFTAFDSVNEIIIAHMPLVDKESEIPALQVFLRQLDVKEVVVTADALHCQKKTFEVAEEVGAIFITQVKDNQSGLLEQISHRSKIDKPRDNYKEEIEKCHGRIDERSYEVFDAKPMLKKWPEWHLIQSVIRVTRKREVYCRSENKYKLSVEISHYVCNRRLSALRSGGHIREHWFIENKVHHVKDVSYREDYNRKEKNPLNFSTCIDFSLNVLKFNNFKNIKGTLYSISLNSTKYLTNLRGLVC